MYAILHNIKHNTVRLQFSCNSRMIYILISNHSYRQTKRLKTKPYPIELKKTGAALLFMVLNFCATTISLALTHERIPDKAPLPDFLLDNIQTRSWGLTASEIVLQVS